MRRISVHERRARLAARHHLAPSALAETPHEAARDLVAVHATDAATVFLSIAARLRQPDIGAIEHALYEQRTLVRMLGMRRTVFVVPRELVSVVQAACADAIAAAERRRTIQLFEGAGLVEDAATWLQDLEQSTVAALEARGEATAAELSKAEPRLGLRIRMAEGKNYAGWLAVSTRLLFLLAAQGRIVRARPRGSWISSQHRWAPMSSWLNGQLEPRSSAEAQAELVRCWLARFGPGTAADLRWWTGLTAREINQALARLDTLPVDLDGTPGMLLADDLEPASPIEPWVALLPALDATPMGWTAREWFLGPHGPMLFDRSGNIGPTVWADGRIVGGWAQRGDGEIAFRLLEDIGSEATAAIAAAAERLRSWLGATRVTPRFRTPLERALGTPADSTRPQP